MKPGARRREPEATALDSGALVYRFEPRADCQPMLNKPCAKQFVYAVPVAEKASLSGICVLTGTSSDGGSGTVPEVPRSKYKREA